MAYIKKLKYNELVGGTDNTDVYPVTSTEAVYGPDNINQQAVNEDRLRRIELLENNVQSLDGLKEMVEAFISGDYDYQGGLSDNNFTDELKAKLEGLENYNDAELRQLLADINTAKANAADVYTKSEVDDKLGDIQGALTFDDTPTAGSTNPVTSSGIKAYVDATASGGTITGITMNGSSKGTSGVVDLGTVVTQETDPTVPQWAKKSTPPTPSEIGAYTKQETDSNFATKGEIPDVSNFMTQTAIQAAINSALANVVFWGDDVGTATVTENTEKPIEDSEPVEEPTEP